MAHRQGLVHRRGIRLTAVLGAAALLAALCCAVAAPQVHAATTTAIAVKGTSAGRTFDGVGAISGGGGNSRLLTDYPAAQRQQILDYLFKPGYGADLQILKVEIGGDTNSTDGSESSIEHKSGSINCGAGYEWWLMEQAKALNPSIKLYGLAWGAPGWVGGTFWTTDTIDYLVSWLKCASSHSLTINYLGGWNERGIDIAWYEQLRSTLNADGYSGVQIVAADGLRYGVATDIAGNSAFAKAVSIMGIHYPCGGGSCASSSTAIGTGKPIWASEGGSEAYNTGGKNLIQSIVRGYVQADLTAYINWPVVAAVYPNLPYGTDGLVLANQPWSGAYSVGQSLWGHRPGDTVHRARLALPQLRFRLSGRG
jgi:O-glycosyl hydrolase